MCLGDLTPVQHSELHHSVTQCLQLTGVGVQSLLSIYLEEKTQHCDESEQDIRLLQSIWPLSSPSCSFIIITCGN